MLVPILAAAAVLGQPPVRRLGAADRALTHEFTQIRGVVERANGSVVVADRLAEAIVAADLDGAKVTPIGRSGGGPTEYRLPAALVPLAGDSVLLIDEGNNRMAVIGPDDRVHRTFMARTPETGVGLFPRAVDQAGRHYAAVPNWVLMGMGRPLDSLPLVRFLPTANRLETVGWLHPSPEPPPPPDRRQPRIPFIIFGAADRWAASPEGRIAVVRAADYHVDWIEPDGRRVRGPATAWTPIPVTTDDKLRYARDFLANSGIGGKGGSDRPPGGIEATPADLMTDASVRSLVANSPFAAVKPPFTDAAPRISPDGVLWVERSAATGAPSAWDLFDRTGRRTTTIELPPGRRLVGLGRGTVYLAAVNADGIETLERYRL